MRIVYFFILFFLAHSFHLSAQSKYLSNPSFEGFTGQGNAPEGWYGCNDLTTLDTRPYFWFDGLESTDGNSHLGLVMRGPEDTVPKNEDATTKLLQPLSSDSTYYFSVDLALLDNELDFFGDDTLFYDAPAKIRVSGGNDSCSVDEVFFVSDLITKKEWGRQYFEFTPTITCTHLKIEIYHETMKPSYIVLDNLSLGMLEISGEKTICQGEQNVIFSIPYIECATDFQWSYSGTGADLTSNGDNVSVNFDSTATGGWLSLRFNNCDKGVKILYFEVKVEELSENSVGTIIGDSEVCKYSGSTLYYATGGTSQNYTWSYSTPGASLSSYSDSVWVYFNNVAEDGYLSVKGDGACKSVLPVKVKSQPTHGFISGEEEVCQNQKREVYKVEEMSGATEYTWSLSGEGVTMDIMADSVLLDFTESTGTVYLNVRGANECGTGGYASHYINVLESDFNGIEISGQNEFCTDAGTAYFSASYFRDATEYLWQYDGEGVNISGNKTNIELSFTEGATNGNLTVSASNKCATGPRSPVFPITLIPIPTGAGEIIGESEVCLMQQNVRYELSGVEHASGFTWAFNGKDFNYSSYSDHLVFDYGSKATNGVLRMTATNRCGIASNSVELPINVNGNPSVPEIEGNSRECVNSSSVFRIKSIEDATNFLWNYSGEDSILDVNFDEITLELNTIGELGILTATAVNECGSSEPSLPFAINVELCDLHIPNTFSPNGDGVNDFYVIRGLPINSRLSVVDRMGSELYESKNYQNDWDGITFNGEMLHTGTYWYVLTIPGMPEEYKGFIYLKR